MIKPHTIVALCWLGALLPTPAEAPVRAQPAPLPAAPAPAPAPAPATPTATGTSVDAVKAAPDPATVTPPAPTLERARALRAAGDLEGAGRVATELLESYDESVTSEDKALARLLLGTVLSTQQRWDEAAATLRAAGTRLDVADYVAERLARALERSGDLEGALATWTALAADAESMLRHEATIRRAHVLVALGRHADGIRAIDEALRLYPKAPGVRDLQLARAECQLALGRTQAAADAFDATARDWPGSHAAVVSAVRLAVLAEEGVRPTPLTVAERLAHGAFLRSDKRWDEAVAWSDTLVADLEALGQGKSAQALEARREAARAATGAEHWEDALQRWRDVYARRPSDWTRTQIAECLRRMGRLDEALAEHRKRGRGAGVRANMAEILFLEGRYQEAWEIESQLHRRDTDGRWHLAWLDYQRGKPLQAAKAFGDLSRAIPWERATYWQARAYVKAGKPKRAIPLFNDIVERDPLTYYSLQANNRLYELGVVRDEWKTLPPDQLPDTRATGARIHWPTAPAALASTVAGVPGRRSPLDDAPDDLLDRLAADTGDVLPEVRKAALLARIGDVEDARLELRYALATFYDLKAGVPARTLAGAEPNLLHDNRRQGEKEGLWGLRLGHRWPQSKADEARTIARLEGARKLPWTWRDDATLAASRLGDWYEGRVHAAKTGPLGAWPTAQRLERWRASYPRAYPETMGFFTEHYGLHPELMWAVMRVESAFNPWAISIAGARGLLQVMPKTGRLIAARTGYGEFSQEMLLDPEMSIYFGTWYMGQLIEKFHGQEPLAITSYNTGPHRIASWLERKGSIAFDEFQEETPYLQGREYTKKVLKYVLLYRWLYDGVRVLYVPNTLDPAIADNINF